MTDLRPLDAIGILLFAGLVGALSFLFGAYSASRPPPPITYRIEVRETPATVKSCKELFKKQLKGV